MNFAPLASSINLVVGWLLVAQYACCPPSAAASAGYQYISPVSGATFVLDTKPANFSTAEAYCNTQGGHLVYYTSVEEQVGAGAGAALACSH